MRGGIAAVVCAFSLGLAAPAAAQSVTRPAQSWRSIRTPHFDFHTPRSLEHWTRRVAARMESYAAAVTAFVGQRPAGRVTVIVDDPSGDPNGFAVPLLGEPVIMLWPTPPMPSITLGEYREWGEIVAVHEFAHIAHLTYPSRNARERFWWSLLPARLGPVARKVPPWVFEGFATLIEGRLTGSGRPHSTGRAAILRQWALEGKLPSYGALDNPSTFLGGAMRYLVGSAYLEWLAERKGERSLEYVWRRLSAREPRSFDAAFAGVYGAPPADLYGQFLVELTAQALRARELARALEPSEGELFQRLLWNTGEPGVSRDGQHIAVPLRQPGRPARLVVWKTGPEGVDSAFLRRRARILARDSLDVAPFDSFPLPRRSVATLRAVAGAGYNNPRWLPRDSALLVSREVPLGNGASRADLFVWSWRSGRVRRVTRGAGIRYADPHPDGRRAVASRCAQGRCGLVMVDLVSGTLHELVRGAFDEVWHRPRWSHYDQRIAASVHRNGRWQIAVLDTSGENVHYVATGDSASRHSPAWSGLSLVVVSDRGGAPNLELLDPATGGVHIMTRSLGAVASPDQSMLGGGVWYLDLHAKGLDLRRYVALTAPSPDTMVLPQTFAPVAPLPAAAASTFDSSSVQSRPYGLGPRRWRYYPGFGAGADGGYALLAITNYDPVGKLGVLAQGAYGQRRTWRGASLGAAWRGWSAMDVVAHGFLADFGAPRGAVGTTLSGGTFGAGRTMDYGAAAWSWHVGVTAGRVELGDSNAFQRAQGSGEVAFTRRRSEGLVRALTARLHGSAGETGQTDVRRGIVSLGSVAAIGSWRLRLGASAGRVSLKPDSLADDAEGAFEAFSVGGLTPFFEPRTLPQRLSVPALPTGSAVGRAFTAYRASLALGGIPASLYAAWFKVYDPDGDWQRLLGGEGELAFPAIGFVSLPNVALSYGAAYSVDHPRRRRWTLYAGARFAP